MLVPYHDLRHGALDAPGIAKLVDQLPGALVLPDVDLGVVEPALGQQLLGLDAVGTGLGAVDGDLDRPEARGRFAVP